MAQMGRPGLSLTQKKELWRRWKKGESLSEIGRALGRHAGSIHGVVKANGGIVPAARTRSARTLSVTEREEISRGLAHHESIRRIAARLRRAPSTVWPTSLNAAGNPPRSRPGPDLQKILGHSDLAMVRRCLGKGREDPRHDRRGRQSVGVPITEASNRLARRPAIRDQP